MLNKLRIFLLAALLPATLVAQDVVDEAEEPEIRRYAVEIIIFRYAENVAAGSEVFLPDEPVLPETDEALGILEEMEPVTELATVPEEAPEPLPDIELALYEEDDFQLQSVHRKLVLLDAYEPLMHFGWTQATWPEEQTEAIPLALFGRPPEGLDGSLTLYLSRYLHLVVDLDLLAPQMTDEPPVHFRIRENRILKNGELRYFDHPKFGVLAKVLRVEDDEEVPEDGELLGYPLQ